MTSNFHFASSEADLLKILPLLVELIGKSGAPLSTALQEISSPNSLILIEEEEDGKVIGYLCGYPLNQREFYLSQAINKKSKVGRTFYKVYEDRVRAGGYQRMFCHTILNPRVFERYGFKLERYVLGKELTNDDKRDE